MKFLCWSYTIVKLSSCKTRGVTLGHFRDILIHWPKKPLGCCLSQLQSLFIIGFWMLHDGPASRVEKTLALKPFCGKRWSSVFIRWRSKSLFCALVSPPVMKNETKSMIGITKLICCFPKCRRQTRFFDKRAAKLSKSCCQQSMIDCWQQEKLRCMILLIPTWS